MLGENKNLKDLATTNLDVAVKDNSIAISYKKTNKLITALFMVTDTMDKEEPLRNKLRFLGAGIISDTYSNPSDSDRKISEILSFLDISFAIGMISEMNSNILKKEFFELQQSIKEFISKKNPTWLEEFIAKSPLLNEEGVGGGNSKITTSSFELSSSTRRREFSKGQGTRIGVQKGSTLMKVLSDKVSTFPNIKPNHTLNSSTQFSDSSYDILKNKRRDEILSIIKNKLSVLPNSGGATITDIKNSAEGTLVSCSEKTLQRELVSMIHDGVLKKTGEKRWSRYVL